MIYILRAPSNDKKKRLFSELNKYHMQVFIDFYFFQTRGSGGLRHSCHFRMSFVVNDIRFIV